MTQNYTGRKINSSSFSQDNGPNICGVDLLRSNHGSVVMEVNSSPGLEGVEKATGINVAGKMIELIEKNAKSRKTKTSG